MLNHLRTYESVTTTPKAYLSQQENQALKLIYKFLRDVLLDLKLQISRHHQKAQGKLSVSSFLQEDYKPHRGIRVSSEPNKLLTDFDSLSPSIRQAFPALQKEFYIALRIRDEGAAIKSKTEPLRILGLEIGTTKLLNYPEPALKSSLQHEVQHIANLQKEGVEQGDFSDNPYIYLASAKEIDSHAKQFAYLYAKAYPQEQTIDTKKLQAIDMVPRSKEKLNLYLWFMSPEQFRQQRPISDEVYRQIKAAGLAFAQKMRDYLALFRDQSTTQA